MLHFKVKLMALPFEDSCAQNTLALSVGHDTVGSKKMEMILFNVAYVGLLIIYFAS